jgi:hypothetical protein
MPKPTRKPRRRCGECQVCCTIMAVADLSPPKKNWTPCPHLCARGCGIYPTRRQPTLQASPPSCTHRCRLILHACAAPLGR